MKNAIVIWSKVNPEYVGVLSYVQYADYVGYESSKVKLKLLTRELLSMHAILVLQDPQYVLTVFKVIAELTLVVITLSIVDPNTKKDINQMTNTPSINESNLFEVDLEKNLILHKLVEDDIYGGGVMLGASY